MVHRGKTVWRQTPDLESLKSRHGIGMAPYIGIEITEVGPDYLKGTMQVDHRTRQPLGMLHGGASVAFAETLGSVAGNHCVEEDQYCVGLDINSNHIRAVSEGVVVGTATPYHLGKTTQVWHIEIHTEDGRLVNVSRLTLAVIRKPTGR